MRSTLEIAPSATPRREPWLPLHALTHVVVLAAAGGLAVTLFVVVFADGLAYYTTPVASRGLQETHAVLRPSGSTGHLLGIAGLAVMLGTMPYLVRKRWKRLSRVGRQQGWLEFHIFCGVFGPLLVTLHTSFKFNGLVSVAYWSMVLVVLSGIAGRYIYVRIPKTLRGAEVSLAELVGRAEELRGELAAVVPAAAAARLDALETPRPGLVDFLVGDIVLGRRLKAARAELASVTQPALVDDLLAHVEERAQLLRRIAYLGVMKKAFDLWHVFHRPLVWVMFGIAALHVGVAVYFGYALGGR